MIETAKTPEFQNFFTVPLDEKIAKIIQMPDRQKLFDAYINLFSGFSRVNWTNKYSLGRAWQTAITQCDAFIKTKNMNNPAAIYIKDVYQSHKKYWSRIIMTHQNRENTINANTDNIKQFRAQAENMIRESVGIINLILEQYNTRAYEQIVTHQQQAQSQPTMTPQTKNKHIYPEKNTLVNSAAQSGHFPMVRNAKKQMATVLQEKPLTNVPGPTLHPQAMPATNQREIKNILHKQGEAPVKSDPITKHTTKSVAQPIKKSGALPAVRNITKQPNVVKQVNQTDAKDTKKIVAFARAKKQIELQQIQNKLQIQQKIQMLAIAQHWQNVA